ncbi:hypothetical protein [Hymenobacter sp. AT01-02]|uniref:hypothetical protein n=1 Tax=Hymenobacter sp. AT01-02 TaxID=1571877 RepID=UPI0005F23853|nr:hypothetical protein [Hymenobacter sp. AT01-02]
MASNLNYLDPTLQPLEEKLKAYLATEKEIQQATTAATLHTHPNAQPHPAPTQPTATAGLTPEPTATPGSAPATDSSSHNQERDDAFQRLHNLQDELRTLRHDILGLLPVRNEWVKVNLGYGPSRAGAFTTDDAQAEDEIQLRIVI